MRHTASEFDAKFEQSDDPWGFTHRWYEERKRAVTLAALPQRRYASAYEPGCANGVLSMALAGRCDHLLASDGSPKAVALAQERLASKANTTVIEAWLPEDWPEGRFDLIVVSELGYFLTPEAMSILLDRALSSLQSGGILMACHWRRKAADCIWHGDDVHELMTSVLPLPHVAAWLDADFRLDVWGGDGESVAAKDGLVPA